MAEDKEPETKEDDPIISVEEGTVPKSKVEEIIKSRLRREKEKANELILENEKLKGELESMANQNIEAQTPQLPPELGHPVAQTPPMVGQPQQIAQQQAPLQMQQQFNPQDPQPQGEMVSINDVDKMIAQREQQQKMQGVQTKLEEFMEKDPDFKSLAQSTPKEGIKMIPNQIALGLVDTFGEDAIPVLTAALSDPKINAELHKRLANNGNIVNWAHSLSKSMSPKTDHSKFTPSPDLSGESGGDYDGDDYDFVKNSGL